MVNPETWQLHPAVFYCANCMCRLFCFFGAAQNEFLLLSKKRLFNFFISIVLQICFEEICKGIESENYMYIFVKNLVANYCNSVFSYLHMSV